MNKYPQHKPRDPPGHSPYEPSETGLPHALRKLLSGGPPIPSHSNHKFQHGTKSNQAYHPPKHKENRHDEFPKDIHKIHAKHVRTNAIEEIESSDPEPSEEGEGDDQVNHIDEP